MTIFSRAFMTIALALALLRGFIAPGLMLDVTPEGRLAVTICNSHDGPLVLTPTGWAEDGDQTPSTPESGEGDRFCPFASANAPALSVSFEPVLINAAVAGQSLLPTVFFALGRGLAAPPPPAHAPPSLR